MKDEPPALTLKNLIGAFIVLLFGLGISFFVFIWEQIISYYNLQSCLSKKAQSNAVNFTKDSQSKSAVNTEEKHDIRKNNQLNHSAKITQTEPTTNVDDELGNQVITVDIHNQSTY